MHVNPIYHKHQEEWLLRADIWFKIVGLDYFNEPRFMAQLFWNSMQKKKNNNFLKLELQMSQKEISLSLLLSL